jgi:hypothetical protein
MEREARRIFDPVSPDVEKELDKRRQSFIAYYLKAYEDFKTNGSFSEFATQYEAECSKMQEALYEQLKLEVMI